MFFIIIIIYNYIFLKIINIINIFLNFKIIIYIFIVNIYIFL